MSPISRELLRKYIEGGCTPEEEEVVHRWLDDNDLDDYSVDDRQSRLTRKVERNWRTLTGQLEELKPLVGLGSQRRIRLWRKSLAAAALAAVLASGVLVYQRVVRSRHVYRTDFGEIKRINLPDGTIVTLNARSEMRVSGGFEKGRGRDVYLQGEAYFQVNRHQDRPFIVHTGTAHGRNGVSITALGTSFDVSAFSDDPRIAVALSEGKVLVKAPGRTGRQQAYLSPGEQAVFDKQDSRLSVKDRFDKKQAISWQVQDIYFENADIAEVLRKLERFYGVSFDTAALKPRHWQLSGEYRNQTLHDVLESLSFNYSLRYRLQGKEVILSDE